jgi:hypothetical protein
MLFFQKLSDISGTPEVEQYKFEEGSTPKGTLITDVNGTIFDYDSNHRMIKSVFSTAIASITPSTTVTPIMDALVNNVNLLAEKVFSDNDINTVSLGMIPGDYMLFDVNPKVVRSYLIPQQAYAHGYGERTSFPKRDYNLVDKIKDSKSMHDMCLIVKIETEEYILQKEKGTKLSMPSCYDINNSIN